MDSEKAASLAEKLVGKELDGWTVERLVDHGKSAAVFAGRKDGLLAAVKIFDTDLIDRYGDSAQLARIERELELRGHAHENLVSIYGGGYEENRKLYYVIMEYLDGPNLKAALGEIKNEQIPALVGQLASAAKFLEDRGLVHRDIKPENIILLEGGRRLVLLDLGVIRPVKGSDLTDPEGIMAFIGTLQYSSPEFLLREEEQNLYGYRAITFYQIGAVLHDLIVRRPLFERFANPYAKLVNAVQFERPEIVNPDVPSWLIQLAQRCLLKMPATRLRMVRWEDFFHVEGAVRATARERVAEHMATVRAQSEDALPVKAESGLPRAIRLGVLNQLRFAATTARNSLAGLPPVRHARCAINDACIDFSLARSADQGFPHGLTIRVCIEVLKAFWATALAALAPHGGLPAKDIDSSIAQFVEVASRGNANADLGAMHFVESWLPRAHNLGTMLRGSREDRVRALDGLRQSLDASAASIEQKEMILGYAAAQVAEGSLNYLSLASRYSNEFPLSVLWFGLFSGLNKNTDILNAGECLGRRISKTLRWPGRNLPPVEADLNFEEFLLLNGEGRLGRIRTGQQSAISIELFPGISGRYRIPRQMRREDELQRRDGQRKEEFGFDLNNARNELSTSLDHVRKVALQLQALLREMDATGNSNVGPLFDRPTTKLSSARPKAPRRKPSK